MSEVSGAAWKERPILFRGAMVRAILDGRKTQTRRVVKTPAWAQPNSMEPDPEEDDGLMAITIKTGCFASVPCPYGVPGDRLWVRETWIRKDRAFHPEGGFWYAATDDVDNPRWRPSIFMPRDACRLRLEVTAVRVERLQEISEEDAKAEGVDGYVSGEGPVSRDALQIEPGYWHPSFYRDGFAYGWDTINGKRASWASNPWVWVITFKPSPAAALLAHSGFGK